MESVTEASLEGLTQRQLSLKVDLANQRLLSTHTEVAGEREVARLASVSLPHAGKWLNCPPMPAMGLHLRGEQFITAVKVRLGMQVYADARSCPACNRPSDTLADHSLCCGTGGERARRHDLLRDCLFDMAVEAGLAPVKEGRALIPGTERRPADLLIPGWCGGRDAALDVTVIHPLQAATRAGAATTPGYALTFAYDRKVRGAGELCRREGIAFIPVVAESLGGLHPTAVEQLRRLARGVAMKTGEEEGTALNHLLSRVSLTLMKGLSSMVLNRI